MNSWGTLGRRSYDQRDAEIARLKREVEVLRERERLAHAEAEDARKHLAELTAMSKRFASSMRAGAEERQHSRRRLAAQYAVSRVLAEASDLDEAGPRIFEVFGERLGWHIGILWTLDRQAGVLRRGGIWRRREDPPGAMEKACEDMEFRRGEGLPGRVWEREAPVWVEDVLEDENFVRTEVAEEEGLRGALAFPIRNGGFVGVFEYFQREVLPPDEDLLRTAALIGDQIGQFLQRRRAEEALRESEARLASDLAGMRRLYDLHAKLASETDLYVALDEILATACEFAGTERGTVQLVSDDGERLEIFANRGYEPGARFIEHFLHEGSKPACDAARQRRQRLIIEDVATFPPLAGTKDREVALADGIYATQSTPMISRKGEMVGVLSTQFSRPHRSSDHELRLVDLLAWTAADFVERHRAEEQLRRAAEFDAFRVTLDDALRPHTDPVEIQAEAARVLGEYLQADRVVYAEAEGRTDEAFSVHRDYHRTRMPTAAGQHRFDDYGEYIARMLRDGVTLQVADVNAMFEHSGTDLAKYEAVAIRAYIAVPLIKANRLVAYLAVNQMAPHEWTPQEVALVEETAERTWNAVQRARAETALRASEERFRQFAENLEDVLWILDTGTGRLEYLSPAYESIWGEPRDAVLGDPERWTELVHPEDRQRAREGMSRLLEGEIFSQEYRIVRPADGEERWILDRGFPITNDAGRTRRVGGIAQDITKRKEAEEQRERFLAREWQVRAAAEERKRISRELHDRVAHSMGVVHQSLELYEVFKECNPSQAEAKMKLAKETTRETLDLTRNISRELHNTEAKDGLSAALSNLLKTTIPPGIASSVSVRGDESFIPPRVREQLFLIIREAIRNATSHSGASRLSIEVKVSSENVVGRVEDDGRGFREESEGAAGPGRGMDSMRERAELVDGTLRLSSAPGKGTKIEASIPLNGVELESKQSNDGGRAE